MLPPGSREIARAISIDFYREMEVGTHSSHRKQALEERGQGMSDTFGGKHESG